MDEKAKALSATERMHASAIDAAKRRFAKHEVVVEGEGRYLCRKPGTGVDSFRVIFAPGAIFFFGDLYELILMPHDRDSKAWLRGTLRDGREIGYPLSKISHTQRDYVKEFCPDLAEEIVAEYEREEPKRAKDWERVREAIDRGDDREARRAWDEVWWDISSDCEFPSAVTWTPMTLFQLEALRWFVRKIEDEEAAARA